MSESVKSHVAQHVPKKDGIVVAIAAVSFVMATAAVSHSVSAFAATTRHPRRRCGIRNDGAPEYERKDRKQWIRVKVHRDRL
jgi:hypothetical protein